MASRVVTQLISDLSGTEIEGGAGESIDFAFRGAAYRIDLTTDEAAEFEQVMAPYIEIGTRAAGTRRQPSQRASGGQSDAKAIREWAQAQGIDVPARGRIPAELREQYAAAK